MEITEDDTKTDKKSLRKRAELMRPEKQEERWTTTYALFICVLVLSSPQKARF